MIALAFCMGNPPAAILDNPIGQPMATVRALFDFDGFEA